MPGEACLCKQMGQKARACHTVRVYATDLFYSAAGYHLYCTCRLILIDDFTMEQ